jgi:transposase
LQHIASLETLIQQVEHWIAAEVEAQHPEIPNLATVPGLGLILAASIAAEIGGIERFFTGQKWDKHHKRWRPKNLRDVEDAVAKMAGLWWPRADSGDFQSEDRRMAKTGNRYLRYAIIQAANGMRRHIPAYTQFYALKYRQATKHKHKRALVLTARKSVGLFVGLLHRNEAFRHKEA